MNPLKFHTILLSQLQKKKIIAKDKVVHRGH